MSELIPTISAVILLIVTGGALVVVNDFLRWKSREQARDFLVKIVDRQHHSLFVRKGMLAQMLANGEVEKYREGHRWVKVGHA